MNPKNDDNQKNKAIALCNADARLLAEFEESDGSGKSFNYSRSVVNAPENVPDEEVVAYLSKIQRAGLVQPFGCLIVIEEPSLKIIGYSENCFDLLGLNTESSLIGVVAKTLFTPSSGNSLANAVASEEQLSLFNPIWVHTRSAQKPFYAILHRIDVGIVIDLEPALSGDPEFSLAGAVQSHKLAVQAISSMQSLPGGDTGVLCDTVVHAVQRLTGYDRVMLYKFHEDDQHGEVVSEIRRSDLEPYLGLHYPATDIPQAARFTFKQSRVRMIFDCNANPVRVLQSEELSQPLVLVNSTLRSPHECHMQYMSNMGSIASLVMAVVINRNNLMQLWGLVAFSLQLNMELQLASQRAEKKTLQTQALLCDLLLRDGPLGVVTHDPTIMDLVKCDGAALYYREKCWLLGVTPTESRIKDMAEWLWNHHGDSTGLSTDSLTNAGYPGADLLGDAVCGMAMARITPKDFLFWFRSHTAKEVKWGGARHHPEDKDDGARMHPRTSFHAFLELAKSRSLPWEVLEINAIHSLQLIIRDSFQTIKGKGSKAITDAQPNDPEVQWMDELCSVTGEMVRLIETAAVPIFGVDSSGSIDGWNSKIAELTGLQASKAMGKSLVNEVIHEDSRGVVENLIFRALLGQEDKNVKIKMRKSGLEQQSSVVHIVANACTSRDYTNNIVGVCFVGEDITSENVVMDKFTRLQGDYKAIIQNLSPLIPPIFASDENGRCSEWNAAMEKLTGWMRQDTVGKMLPSEIFGGICRLKSQEALTQFTILLYRGISGHDTDKFPFGFFNRNGKLVEVMLIANKRTDESGNVIGCFCFLKPVVPDLQDAFGNRQEDREFLLKHKELAYIRQEMKNPLNGIRFIHKLLESTAISEHQKQFLETSDACERQIISILEDLDLGRIEEGKVDLKMEEFVLGNVIDAIVSQVMILLKERNLQLFHEIPEEIRKLSLLGDRMKLQLLLSDFLLNIVHHTPADGWVDIRVSPGSKLIHDGNEFIHLQLRIAHSGQGLPSALIRAMFEGEKQWTTKEGVGLNVSLKLLNRMNGHIRYIREDKKCYFIVELELQTRESKEVDASRMS
ncbi:phytochrome E-like [Cornus florida]|uniref:phytochrome E-like n=1 Tax=Cornus florida TaxID=4283 RepID=UPI00289E0F94|nr:phytochrome E-like [Cornus florida]